MQIFEITKKAMNEASLASTAYGMAKNAAIDYIAKKTNRSRSFYQPTATTPATTATPTTPAAPAATTTTPTTPAAPAASTAPTATTAPVAGTPAATADTGIVVNPGRRIRVVDPRSKGVYFKTQRGWVNELNRPVAVTGVAYLERLADQGLGREENIPPATPRAPAVKTSQPPVKKPSAARKVQPRQQRRK